MSINTMPARVRMISPVSMDWTTAHHAFRYETGGGLAGRGAAIVLTSQRYRWSGADPRLRSGLPAGPSHSSALLGRTQDTCGSPHVETRACPMAAPLRSGEPPA
jgi:hypothetical protein